MRYGSYYNRSHCMLILYIAIFFTYYIPVCGHWCTLGENDSDHCIVSARALVILKLEFTFESFFFYVFYIGNLQLIWSSYLKYILVRVHLYTWLLNRLQILFLRTKKHSKTTKNLSLKSHFMNNFVKWKVLLHFFQDFLIANAFLFILDLKM